MKSILYSFRLHSLLTLPLLFVFLLSCNKDNIRPGQGEVIIDENTQLDESDLETFQGEIGLLIDTRPLVKKGYVAATISISTTATEGNYDQEISVDAFTNLAVLSIPIVDLTAEAEDELRNGVGITYAAKEANGTTIVSETSGKVLFKENGNQLTFNIANLPYAEKAINFQEDMPYYLQLVNPDGTYSNEIVGFSTFYQIILRAESDFKATQTQHQFYFQAHPGKENVYSMYSAHNSTYLGIRDNIGDIRIYPGNTYPLDPTSLPSNFALTIRQESNGLFTINNENGDPLRRRPGDYGIVYFSISGPEEIQYFRILALDVEWKVEEIKTEYLQPIFPAAQTSFGFNSTLINCGSGTLEQEVGIEKEVITSYTAGFEESLSIGSRTTTSIGASVGASAEASFFGVGASISAEVSTNLEVSVDVTQERSQSQEYTSTKKENYFTKRTVEVPPGKASLVYDAYQTYSNVKVPFVKRLLVQATNKNTQESLTGEQISTQLRFSGFNGLITEVGSDYLEVSLRGTTVLDNIIDTKSGVEDVAGKCD